MLSEKAVSEFYNLYLKEFGEELSDTEALELGINLLTFFNHIYHPVKKEWLKEIVKENNKPHTYETE